MSLLPRRFRRLDFVLNYRMSDLTVILEDVEKSHNLSAILRTCDAVGVLEAHGVSCQKRLRIFKSTALGSQKWVRFNDHTSVIETITQLKQRGFKIYGTKLDTKSIEYHHCDFIGPTAFLLGAEKWGLTDVASNLVDQSISIPMIGMVQSLNVSVAAAILLSEVLRQRHVVNTSPTKGEGVSPMHKEKLLFEHAYPQIAKYCRQEQRPYPKLNEYGEILDG